MTHAFTTHPTGKRGERLTVLLTHYSKLISQRLRLDLEEIPELQIVGEAENARAARVLLEAHEPNAVVLDLQLPGAYGLDLLRQIQHAAPRCRTLVLVQGASKTYRQYCLKNGADFVFEQCTELDQVRVVLEQLAAGKSKARRQKQPMPETV